MKRTIISSFCVLILTNFMPAHAQVVIDLSVLTCKQLLDLDAERQALISSWMGGYFSATKNSANSTSATLSGTRRSLAATARRTSRIPS